MNASEARREVWRQARRMWESGLVTGSAGNLSLRLSDDPSHIVITPSSIPYEVMREEQVVLVDLASGTSIDSTERPSYELPMHREIYRLRADLGAIVHTHSPFVTTLSVLRRPLPPVIDEMLLWLGGRIEVAEYSFTGTPELGRKVVEALGDRAGAILSNHGNVCVGADLDEAMHVAVVMESAARVYLQALQAGEPVELPEEVWERGREMYLRRR